MHRPAASGTEGARQDEVAPATGWSFLAVGHDHPTWPGWFVVDAHTESVSTDQEVLVNFDQARLGIDFHRGWARHFGRGMAMLTREPRDERVWDEPTAHERELLAL